MVWFTGFLLSIHPITLTICLFDILQLTKPSESLGTETVQRRTLVSST